MVCCLTFSFYELWPYGHGQGCQRVRPPVEVLPEYSLAGLNVVAGAVHAEGTEIVAVVVPGKLNCCSVKQNIRLLYQFGALNALAQLSALPSLSLSMVENPVPLTMEKESL